VVSPRREERQGSADDWVLAKALWLVEAGTPNMEIIGAIQRCNLSSGCGVDLTSHLSRSPLFDEERVMQTPVEIEFQEMAVSPAVQGLIADHVKKLEQLYGRITACRIVVKGPGNRHQTGGLYDINIRLALPDGCEVNIGRTPKADERHSDLPFAINDGFKRGRQATSG